MMRTGRILLIDPEEEQREELAARLAAAGHYVAAVADEPGARTLLEEGLEPDLVIAGVGCDAGLAPSAVRISLDPPAAAEQADNGTGRGRRAGSAARAVDMVVRVEEALLELGAPTSARDETWCALDLSRRLANALPGTRTEEDRIELLCDTFHAYFGVRGTLVIRRTPGTDEWIEAGQGLRDAVTERIAAEVAARAGERDIRPFLTRLEVEGEPHDVACMAVRCGEYETDLAMDLERAPGDPALREALMNLVGSSLRAAFAAERMERAETTVEAELPVLENLLSMSREFSGVTHRGVLCRKILSAARNQLGMSRSAIFLEKDGGQGMLALQAVSGFSSVMLARIGLAAFHGLAAEILNRGVLCRLPEIPSEGAGLREQRMLAEAGLQWAAPLTVGRERRGLLFFGSKEADARLNEGESRTLRALLGSAAVALRNLDKLEEIQGLSLGAIRGLAAAAELSRPEREGHAERVAEHALALGRALALAPDELRQLSYCALLHDVGKIGIPAGTADDSPEMRKHPILASRVLSRADPPEAVVQGVEQHHERWDGQGYPYGLRGPAIHLFARLVAIADAFDRSCPDPADAGAVETALRRLERGAGLLWDPGLVALFVGELEGGTTRPRTPSREISIEEIVGA
ncbi:MAG TPA: HD domain-containing phosphohydrolase [bacterium]|nr:HD domain-containing phosphohydrolase [bacterium]